MAASSFNSLSNRQLISSAQQQNNDILIFENDHVNFDAIKLAHPQLQEHDLKAIHRLVFYIFFFHSIIIIIILVVFVLIKKKNYIIYKQQYISQ